MDDTLIIGGGGWKNLWSIKVVLRDFELVSGMWVNFHKSRLISINVSKHLLGVASIFLSCKIEESGFMFLGIPIGSNPRRIKMWDPVIDKFSSKLALWKRRFLSFAGRVTLINSILNNLPIFVMSFYKALVKVWR